LFVEISSPADGIQADPMNLSVAKKRPGPYKSAAIDPDSPPDNPQIVRKTNDLSRPSRFFFKIKNPNPFVAIVQLIADGSTSDFTVAYTAGGLDITSDLVACHAYFLRANGIARIDMTITPTGATAGDTDLWGLHTRVGATCTLPLSDAVFAEVRVPL
jgi:hypothetical protein